MPTKSMHATGDILISVGYYLELHVAIMFFLLRVSFYTNNNGS